MNKKLPLYFLLSIPAVFLWIFFFPPSGARELYLYTEWWNDLSRLMLLPPAIAGEQELMDPVFTSGGVQRLSKDGQQGQLLTGDIVAVRQDYRLEMVDGEFVQVDSKGDKTSLGRAGLVLADDHLLALVSEDGFTIRIFLPDDGRSFRYELTHRVTTLEVVDGNQLLAGTADGELFLLDQEGHFLQSLTVKGSTTACIYSLSWQAKDKTVLVLSGLYPQRLVYCSWDSRLRKLEEKSSVELPFGVRFRAQMMPVFEDRLVLFDLEEDLVLYEPSSRLFHAIHHEGSMVNAVMLQGTDVLALASNLGGRNRVSLIKPDGRSIASVTMDGDLTDFVLSRENSLLVGGTQGIGKVRWSFR